MSSNQEAIQTLQKQVTFLIEAFSKCMGITYEEDFISSTQTELKNRSFTIKLSEHIEDVDSFEVVLDTLNLFGNERGYAFKKGTSKQKKGEPATEKTIVCKYKDRNKDKHKETEAETDKREDGKRAKDIDCDARYRFQVKGSRVEIIDCKEDHNHGPNFNFQKTLTSQMIEAIKGFNKFSKPSEIRDYLETRYSRKLDYMIVYNEFRRVFPRFGPTDCQFFIDYLEENGAYWKSSVNSEALDMNLEMNQAEEGPSLCKLFFSTRRMKENLKDFSDVVLIDTTYNVNYYSTPLVVISGFNNKYENVLFGLAFINNEQQTTYKWILSHFKGILPQNPTVVYSDGDLALGSAISESFPQSEHRLCSWHIARNLSRKFAFLAKDNEDLKKKIINLPYLYSKKRFEEDVKEITKFLQDQQLKNSELYLTNILQKKAQWARSFHNPAFDADIITTSRVESWNATIKTYLNSRSELSDVIRFINSVEEKCHFAKKPLLTKAMYSLLEYDPLLKSLKGILPPKIYDKTIIQYNLGKRDYEKKLVNQEQGAFFFEVTFNNRATEDDLIINEIDLASPSTKYTVRHGEKMTCSCNYFDTTGLICRHVFFICFCENVKDMNKLVLSKRWSISLEQVENHFIKPPGKREGEEESALEENKAQEEEENTRNMEIIEKKEEEEGKGEGEEEESERQSQQLRKADLGSENDHGKKDRTYTYRKPSSTPPVKNFEKVEAKKGAPKKGAANKRKEGDNYSTLIQRLEDEVKKLRLELNDRKGQEQKPSEPKEEDEEKPAKKRVANTRSRSQK